MPMAVDPQQRIRVVLASDEGKPKGEQPTFVFRHLTGREHRKIMEFEERMGKAKDGQGDVSGLDLMDASFDIIRTGLVGWEHMADADGKPVAFDPATLEDIIGLDEAYELLGKRLLGGTPSDEDLKNSGSPSPTDGAESVTPNQSASAEKEKDVPAAK